jgi:hypothetical protein|tara:strand:- start:274 stop:486 length:213 start_codon:yes stop_codon:yes gene_type:complete
LFTWLAGFLTPEQLAQYNNRSSQSVQVMSLSSDGADGAALIIEESDFITEGEDPDEIIFEEGEPPLPPEE